MAESHRGQRSVKVQLVRNRFGFVHCGSSSRKGSGVSFGGRFADGFSWRGTVCESFGFGQGRRSLTSVVPQRRSSMCFPPVEESAGHCISCLLPQAAWSRHANHAQRRVPQGCPYRTASPYPVPPWISALAPSTGYSAVLG